MTCLSELRGLGAITADLQALGVRTLAISVDPPAQSRRVVERQHLPFPILADEQRQVIRALGLLHAGGAPNGDDIALPALILLDPGGRIRWRYVADRIQNRLDEQRVLVTIREQLYGPNPPAAAGPAESSGH